MMTEYIADFDKITSYWVNLVFSKIIKPSILYNDPLQFVSIKTEILTLCGRNVHGDMGKLLAGKQI